MIEIQQNWAVVIHAKVLLAKDINHAQKILLGLISNLTNIDDECYATNEYFSSILGVTKSSGRVSRLLSDLEKKGYLKTECFYKENTKEIEKRIIRITMQFNKGGVVQNNKGGIVQKDNRGIVQKDKENNTLLNSNTLRNTNTLLNQKTNNTHFVQKFNFDDLLAFGKAEIEKLNLDFSKYEYSLKTKLETWQESGWKDGHGKPIKNPKLKIKNIIPYLKPMEIPKPQQKNYENDLQKARLNFKPVSEY
jgi:hypothetical protein